MGLGGEKALVKLISSVRGILGILEVDCGLPLIRGNKKGADGSSRGGTSLVNGFGADIYS